MSMAAQGRGSPRKRVEAESPRDPAKRETLRKLAALGVLALLDVSALSSCGRRAPVARAREPKVIVLGLDGLDPQIVGTMMEQGRLPHMSRLRERGGFRALTSSVPPQSPVAWATFTTGQDPGRHGIHDFVHRDPATYGLIPSVARTAPPELSIPVGQWRVPLTGSTVELQRRGRAFWDVLQEEGVPCAIYWAPANFPPRDTGPKQLAGLGTPDFRGTNGEYSYFTEMPAPRQGRTAGKVQQVRVRDGRAQARLIGPFNSLHKGLLRTHLDFEVWLDRGRRLAKIAIGGEEVLLREREWSDWVPLRFTFIPHVNRKRAICRFYLKEVSPGLKLYVSPINFDPLEPALPISAPRNFSRELAERFGRFHTLGLPEDYAALTDGILDEDEYLQQSGLVMEEGRRIYESALNEFERGLLFCYFGTSDRAQHLFWHMRDPRHPAHDAALARRYGSVIEDCYRECDDLVGATLEAAGAGTAVIVLSDHGFAPYYRRFSLNTWLAENGYFAPLPGGREETGVRVNARWEQTAAYGVGLNGVYLNLEGREARGTVRPEEREALARRLARQLRAVRDPETGARVIENVYLSDEVYADTLPDRAPDLIVGYARGYRCSTASAEGLAPAGVIDDNREKWSGDHCIDRSVVPGILLATQPIRAAAPGLTDVTASVLAAFGLAGPEEMRGKPIW